MIPIAKRREIRALHVELKKIHQPLTIKDAAKLHRLGVSQGQITTMTALSRMLSIAQGVRQRQKAKANAKPRNGPRNGPANGPRRH